MTTNNTLDLAEIAKLPMRRDLQYNGLTRDQVVAIGADPDEVEAARLSQNEWAAGQQLNENVQIVEAAQQLVAEGEATWSEVAQALLQAGNRVAHDTVVQIWQEEEGWYSEQEAAEDLAVLDANQYVEHFNAQQARERSEAEADVAEAKRQLSTTQVEEMQSDLQAFIDSTPGAHQLAPAVEHRLVQNLKDSGVLPATTEERATAIETALKETVVLGDATESIRQQVDAEYRIHRKATGARDGLMTAADIAAAEAIFKQARFKQLAEAKMINREEMKPSPTAEAQSEALVKKYSERQDRSTSLQQQVAGIAERGKDANASRDRGEGISEEKRAYREALARAEEKAAYGSPDSGYGASHEATVEGTVQETATDSGLPAGWVDEFGPGGYS